MITSMFKSPGLVFVVLLLVLVASATPHAFIQFCAQEGCSGRHNIWDFPVPPDECATNESLTTTVVTAGPTAELHRPLPFMTSLRYRCWPVKQTPDRAEIFELELEVWNISNCRGVAGRVYRVRNPDDIQPIPGVSELFVAANCQRTSEAPTTATKDGLSTLSYKATHHGARQNYGSFVVWIGVIVALSAGARETQRRRRAEADGSQGDDDDLELDHEGAGAVSHGAPAIGIPIGIDDGRGTSHSAPQSATSPPQKEHVEGVCTPSYPIKDHEA